MHQKLSAKAMEMGVSVRVLAAEGCGDAIQLSHDGKSVIFEGGFPLELLNAQLDFIAANKQLTKELFQRIGIPCPRSLVFRDAVAEKIVLERFWEEGRTYVLKPLDGTDGDGVLMHQHSLEEVVGNWRKWKEKYETFLLEEQVEGGDLRIQAIGGELVAAVIREPAHVRGDGAASLRELIERRRKVIESQNSRNQLPIDAAAEALMEAQGVTMDSVIEKERKVFLKYVSNMSLGGIAIDVTDGIHEGYRDWVSRFASETGASVFALDIMTLNPELAPGPGTAWALEVNVRPHWLHHTFSEGRQHDIPGMLLREVFGLK